MWRIGVIRARTTSSTVCMHTSVRQVSIRVRTRVDVSFLYPPNLNSGISEKPHTRLQTFAAAYLETEAYVNRRLSLESNGRKCPYIAPYIWEYTTSEGTKQLVWGVISAVHSRIYGAYARKCLGLCICIMRIVCTAKNAIDAHKKKRFSCGILL